MLYPPILKTDELLRNVEASISCDYEIVGESDEGLELFDVYGERGGGYFPLRFPEEITEETIRKIISIPEAVTQKYPKLTAEAIAKNLFQNLDRNTFCCVTKIDFVDSTDNLDALQEEDDYPEQLYNENDRLTDELVGLFWYSRKVVIVNLHAIEAAAAELTLQLHCPEERLKETEIGIWVTLIHELRHSMLDNPFLPEEDYPLYLGEEDEVEEYSREVFEKHIWSRIC